MPSKYAANTDPLGGTLAPLLAATMLLHGCQAHRHTAATAATAQAETRLIVVVMLGMNAFSQRDTRHPFEMHPYGHLPTWFQAEVRPSERDRSTLFFEAARAAEAIQREHGLADEEILLIFGRGTPSRRTERQLVRNLLAAGEGRADDALVVVVAKSLGALDTLEALGRIQENPDTREAVGRVHMLVLVDPAGPRTIRNRLCATHLLDGRAEARLRIPALVDRTWNVVQRESSALLQGQLAGAPDQTDVHNRVLTNEEVGQEYRYCCYADGTDRQLEACHFHMEELVSSMPCFEIDGELHTLGPLIQRGWELGWGAPAEATVSSDQNP